MFAITLAMIGGSLPQGIPAHPQEALHRSVRLELEDSRARLEHRAELEGSLHVWVAAATFDPGLRVSGLSQEPPLEDQDSGGGTTAWLRLEVEAGSTWQIEILAPPGSAGFAELHLVAAPESSATRAASSLASERMRAAQELRAAEKPQDAQREMAKAVAELLAVEGALHSEQIAAALWEAGRLAWELGALEAAGSAWGAAHDHRRRTLPETHPELLRTMAALAVTRKELGDLRGALDLEQAVLSVREEILPPDHPELLAIRLNLATTLKELGQLRAALALEESVLAARERLLPPEHRSLLGTKLNLSRTRKAFGDTLGALALCDSVRAALERTLPEEHEDVLAAKLNSATLRKELGDLDGALELEEQVLAAFEELLPPDHPSLLIARQNLSNTRILLGDPEGALEFAESVYAARTRLLPPGHPHLSWAMTNLAAVRAALGDQDGARELQEAVLAASIDFFPPDHPAILTAKENLGTTLERAGELERALALFEEVHAVREELLPRDHEELLAAKLNLSVARLAAGDEQGALALVRSLLACQLAVCERSSAESPRVARASARAELQRLAAVLELCASMEPEALAREPGLAAELFAVLESARAVSLSSPELAHAAARSPELETLRADVERARKSLNDLVLAAPENVEQLDAWRQRVFEGARERDELERALRAELARRGVRLELPSAARVARGLAEGAALLSYFRLSPPAGAARSDDVLMAFVVTPAADVRWIDLGPAQPIEDCLLAWRASFGSPLEARGVPAIAQGEASAPGDLGAELRGLVLDPVLASVPELRTLHVVLDDFLHLMPLAALPVEGGTLGERWELRQETSVLRLVGELAPPLSSEPLLVALGGIDYDADTEAQVASEVGLPSAAPPLGWPASSSTARSGASAVPFLPLKGAQAELDAIGELHRARFAGESLLLRGGGASKAALWEAAPRARFLHLATHGWFAPEAVRSGLDLAVGGADEPSIARAERTVLGFAPEVLCGLALAGANRGMDRLGKVPGILTAEELAALDLSNCELAVLSACETNVGPRRAGQGIQSLQTALHAAGARSAITSLWKVDDEATRLLFASFYAGLWTEGLGKAAALERARRTLREAGHPLRDWGAWVLTGDPD